MTNTEKLTELLTMSRSSHWTSENSMQLAETLRAATDDELRMALMHFTQGLLRTAHTIKSAQLHAAIGQAAIEERDQHGGLH